MSEWSEENNYYIKKIDDQNVTSILGPMSRVDAESLVNKDEVIIHKPDPQIIGTDGVSDLSDLAPDNVDDMVGSLKKWGFVFIVLGILNIAIGGFSSISWAILLIIIGLSTFLFRSSAMFLVFGVTFSWAIITYFIIGFSGSSTSIIVQIAVAVMTFRRFFRWQQVENDFMASPGEKDPEMVKYIKRTAAFFPFISIFASILAVAATFILIIFLIVLNEFFSNALYENVGYFGEEIILIICIIGFSSGLASFLLDYRYRALSVAGTTVAALLLVGNILLLIID